MTPIQSKRSFLGFYLYLLAASFFCLLIAFLVIAEFVHLYMSPQFEAGNYGLLPLFFAVMALFVYIIYRLIKRSPALSVDGYAITVNGKTYHWAELETVALTGKKPFLFFYQKEAMTLKFKQGNEFYMIDDLYSNLSQIKLFIQYRVIEKNKTLPEKIENPDAEEAGNESFSFYKGPQLLNFRGVLLWLILAGLGFAALKSAGHPVGLMFIAFFACLAFFGLSYFLYYFGISESYLIVRNHNFFWVKKIYRLKDIKEIVFEQQDRWPNCVVVITNDFKSNFLPAATLWGKDFRAFKQELLSKNITIRDEIHVG